MDSCLVFLKQFDNDVALTALLVNVAATHHASSAEYWLIARRSLANWDDVAYFTCHTPKRIVLADLARVAGTRWAIGETFQTAKG
jgi:hypothetical protein